MADGGSALAAVETPELEQPVEQQPEERGAENTSGAQESTAARTETQQPTDKADLRNRPDAARKALKWLSEQNNGEYKGVASVINNTIGRERAYAQVFPKVEEARAAKTLIDSVGGTDGISKLQSTFATIEQVDQQIAAGDPAALDHFFDEESREGMTKLIPSILDRVAQMNPQAYAQAITPHAVKWMESEGLVGALNGLINSFNRDDKAGVTDILSKIVSWYNEASKNSATVQQANPERQKFEQEKAEWQKKQHDSAVNEVFASDTNYAGEVIDRLLKPLLPKLGLDKDGLELLRQNIFNRYQQDRKNENTFKIGMNSRYQNGKGFKDANEAKQFLRNYMDSHMQASLDAIVQPLYGKILRAPAKPNPTAPAKAAPAQAAKPTKPADPYQRPVSRFDQVLAREVGKLRTQAR